MSKNTGHFVYICLPCFLKLTKFIQKLCDPLRLIRIKLKKAIIFPLKKLRIAKLHIFPVVLPVVQTLVISKKDIHICAVLCDLTFPHRLFPNRMKDAAGSPLISLRLIKPGKKQDHKSHVVAQCNLTGDSVFFPQFPAQAAVKGSVQVKIEVLNNKELISNAESRPGVVRIQTEELQSKQFSLIMNTYGNLAEDYAINKAILTPDHVMVEGPTSQIGLINHVGIELNVNGLESGTDGTAEPVFYDANGNEITVSDRVHVSPAEIQYSLEVSKVKNLPLDFEVTGTAASGYQYTGVECSIKSISVLGLKNSLASVNKITIPSSVLSVAGATQDKVVTVNLNDYLPEDVSLANTDDANVTIRLKVEQLTTRIITLGEPDISMENGADYYHYHLSPARIEVKLQGLKEDLNTLKPADLKATVNLSGMQLGTYTGTLNMGGLGKNFKLLSVSAFSVEVTAGGPAAQLDQTTADEEEADEEDSSAENSNTKIQDTETSGANAG